MRDMIVWRNFAQKTVVGDELGPVLFICSFPFATAVRCAECSLRLLGPCIREPNQAALNSHLNSILNRCWACQCPDHLRWLRCQLSRRRSSRFDRVNLHSQVFDETNSVFSAAVLFAALPAQDYTLGPDSQPHDGVPKGTVTKFMLPPGKYYPGTPHNYSVYVPAQYDASKPTPFMIFLDGSQALGNGMRVPGGLRQPDREARSAADDRHLHRSRHFARSF